MARLVLVHGAFHGAWAWDGVADILRSHGHSVQAIDLPGSGRDATPLESVTLNSYVDAIGAALAAEPEPAVLVSHSMGGFFASQAAVDFTEHVRQIIYVAAFVPIHGETLLALTQRSEAAGEAIGPNMVVDGQPPVATMPREPAIHAFYGETESAVAAAAADKLGAQPVLPYLVPFASKRVITAPRRYVLTLKDRAIPVPLQKMMSGRGDWDEVVEIETDHSPFLSAPTRLAETLEGFVAK